MRATLVILAGLLALPVSASAAPRSAVTSEGVRLTLDGRTVTVAVPRQTAPRARIRVECGLDVFGARRTAQATAPAPAGRTVRLRLPRALADAEWCAFETIRRGAPLRARPSGAARLRPELEPLPAPVPLDGPGVRVARASGTSGSDGTVFGEGVVEPSFAAAGRVVTVRFGRPVRRSTILTIVCGDFRLGPGRQPARRVAVRRGQRAVTADLGGDTGSATSCLLEAGLFGGEDIAAADFD